MNKKFILSLSLLAALAFSAPTMTYAAPKKEKPAAAADETRPIPYHGSVSAVDAGAKTFTIKGKQKDRVFTVTDKTTITKDGAAAEFAAITVGEEIRGQATKSGDNWEAVKVMLGAKEKEGKAAKGGKKEEAKPAGDAAAPATAAPAAPAAEPAPAAPAGDAAK